MRSIVDELDNEVRYHVVDGDPIPTSEVSLNLLDDLPLTGVELRYYCPYCDRRNRSVHTTPLTNGIRSECLHCSREIAVTESNDTGGTDLTEVEETARRLERKRQARLLGERTDEEVFARAERARQRLSTAVLIFGHFLMGIMLFGPLYAISGFEFSADSSGVFGVFALVALIGLIGVAALDERRKMKPVEVVSRYTDVPGEYAWDWEMIQHGRAVAEGDVDLYIPPVDVGNKVKMGDGCVERNHDFERI